jgi:hypothetical protein
VDETADFLREKGFHSYAQHCLDSGLTGMMIIGVSSRDVDGMPEQNNIKKTAFLRLLKALNEKAGYII